MTRADQLKEKRRRLDRLRQKHWDRVATALAVAGWVVGPRGLSEAQRRWLTARRAPPPEVVCDPSFGAGAAAARTDVERALARATVRLNDIELPLTELYATLLPLVRDPRVPLVDRSGSDTPLAADVRRQLVAEGEGLAAATLDEVVGVALAGHAEPDAMLHWYRSEADARGRLRVTLGAAPPHPGTAAVDGRPRPVYRCGGGMDSTGFRWIDWPPEAAGGSGDGPAVPVYVQAHALDRLHQRLPVGRGAANWSLLRSLASPVITRRDGDSLLVEYRLWDRGRVGHLVVRRQPEAVVVTTFLFLTMQGTPEARRLFDALRLRRPDIEFTGLDDLRSFVNSDLADDPDLRPIFESCGCGALIQLRADGMPDHRPRTAQALRQYLGDLKVPRWGAGDRLREGN